MTDLKQARQRLGLTIMEVASKASVSIALVWGVENCRVDRTKMQGRTYRALSRIYGVDLITGDPYVPEPEAATTSAA